MPRVTGDPERRVKVTLEISQKIGTYTRDEVASARITADYPLDIEAVLSQVRATLGLIVANVDVMHGTIPVEVEVAPEGPFDPGTVPVLERVPVGSVDVDLREPDTSDLPF